MDEHEHSGRKGSDGGTSTSDQEALVDVPLSFELSGFEPLPVGAARGPYASDVPALPKGHGASHAVSLPCVTLELTQAERLVPLQSGIMQPSTT